MCDCDWMDPNPIQVDWEQLMDHYRSQEVVCAYLKEIRQVPPLTTGEEAELAALAVKGNQEARNRMIETHLDLVVAIAATYEDQHLFPLDAIQVGNIGLFQAVNAYDPQAGIPFGTFAQPYIHRAIQQELSCINVTRRIPVELVERINAVFRCHKALKAELGREPKVEELMEALHMTQEEISRGIQLEQPPVSLDAPVSQEEDTTLGDFLPDETDLMDSILPEREARLQELFDRLTPREAAVLRMRFGLEDGHTHTLEEVAEAFGVTRERIRQIERKAIRPRHIHRRKPISDFYK